MLLEIDAVFFRLNISLFVFQKHVKAELFFLKQHF